MATEHVTLLEHSIEEVWNQGNVAVIHDIFTPDYVHHDPFRTDIRTRDDYTQWVTAQRHAFPDFHLTIDDHITDGEKGAIRWSLTATHHGDLPTPHGILPATGRQIHITGITAYRLEDGKIAEDWHMADIFSLMQQLGVLPGSSQAEH